MTTRAAAGHAGRGCCPHHPRAGPHDQAAPASTSQTCPTRSLTTRWATPPARASSSAPPAALWRRPCVPQWRCSPARSWRSVEFEEVRGTEGIKEAAYDVAGMDVKVAVASGLTNATQAAGQGQEPARQTITSSRSWAAPAAVSTAAASPIQHADCPQLHRSEAPCARQPCMRRMRT